MEEKDYKRKSCNLAFLLRHDKDYKFDSSGWREVSDLVKNHGYTKSELEKIVASDSKGRYEFDLTKNRIRACQGHSISGITSSITQATPPSILYHGTCSRFIDSILSEGIQKRSRNHVHLSTEKDTAINVGSRHGDSIVVIIIDVEKMLGDGIKFYKSSNGVWLVDEVLPKYFSRVEWIEKIS